MSDGGRALWQSLAMTSSDSVTTTEGTTTGGTATGGPATGSTRQRPAAPGRRTSARQAELLDRLRDLFLAEGFAHFTLDDLAARLRCSKSTLYALADSKEQLAVRVVGHYFKGAAAEIERRVAEISDLVERVGGYLDGAAEALRPASREFIDDMAANAATRKAYEDNARAAAERIRSFITEGVERGVFRQVHPGLVAEMVSMTLSAIQRGEIGARTGLSDAEAFAALAQFLIGGLAARP